MVNRFVEKIYKNRYMIISMAKRDIKSRYIGSMLGLVWSIIQPLTTFAVYYFVFSFILKVRLSPDTNINFAAWLMCGLLPWLFFAETLSRSANILLDNSTLITKTNVDSEMLPIMLITSNFINHLIGLVMLFVIGLSLNLFKFEVSVLRLPIYMMLLIYFSIGLSWITSSLNVFLRDIGQLIGVILNVWFYATPIVYPYYQVSDNILKIIKLNPLYFIVEGYRNAIFNDSPINWNGIIYLFSVSTILFIIGGLVFKKLKNDFGDVL